MKKLLFPLLFICIFSGCSGKTSDLKYHLDDAVTNTNRAIEKIDEMQSYLIRNHTRESRVSADEMKHTLMPMASEASEYAKKTRMAFETAQNYTKDKDLQRKIVIAGRVCNRSENDLHYVYMESKTSTIATVLESIRRSLMSADETAEEILSSL